MSGVGDALFRIRRFLEEKNADEDVMKAWEEIRDWITKLIGEMLKTD